jgi:hypothetical protein
MYLSPFSLFFTLGVFLWAMEKRLPMVATIEDMKAASLQMTASQARHVLAYPFYSRSNTKMYLSPFFPFSFLSPFPFFPLSLIRARDLITVLELERSKP